MHEQYRTYKRGIKRGWFTTKSVRFVAEAFHIFYMSGVFRNFMIFVLLESATKIIKIRETLLV
jgi:hypothetical protein